MIVGDIDMAKDKKTIVGLDIGTSKIVAVIAEVLSDGRHEIIGIGQRESNGLKNSQFQFCWDGLS